MTDRDPEVFRALADPTRRALLDRLFDGAATVGELSALFEPDMTRFGVRKHLRQLEEAGLVVARAEGRTTRLFLNPIPLRELSRRWMDKYTERRADALIDLKRSLENTHMTEIASASDQLYQVFIKAPPEAIWQAITDPEVTAKYFHGARIRATAEQMISLGPDGAVWGDSEVEVFDPPHRLVYGWSSLYSEELAAEPMSRVSFEITEVGEGVCKLVVVHDRLEGSPKTAESVGGEGWMFVLSNLKSWLETGETLTLAG